jgi:hypothetical protein
MTENKKYPSPLQQVKNLAGFSWEVMKYIHEHQGEILFVSEDVYKERYSTCKGCEKFDEMENKCMECGCYIPGKARVILDSCPLGKWTADKGSWEEKFDKIAENLDNSSESL